MFEIVRSKYESDRESDFVALGNTLVGNYSNHSSFIIKYEGQLFEFHYDGYEIGYDQIIDDYYHKITDTILEDEVPAFISYCKNIKKNGNPKYGYFYSGESYNQEGIHLSNVDLGEVMTCVGFCLNVLKGFHEEDYLEFTDWTSDSHDKPDYLKDYCEKYDLDIDKVTSHHRRITPREFLVSGYFMRLPITKQDIDGKIEEVDEYFNNLFDTKSA
jgi:hypothetical protein